MPSDARHRPAFLNVLDGLRSNVQRDQRLQGGVAVGLGVDGVGFRLLRFALRNAVVLEQILVQVGQPAVGLAVASALR